MSTPRCWIPLLLLVASPAFAGWSMTQVTTSSGDREEPGSNTRQRVWMDGSSAKVEMLETDNPMMPPGSYLLMQDGGKRVFMVDPERQTYARFDPAAIGREMEAMDGSGLEVTIEEPRMVKLLEEPGGEMLGQATTHYRYRTTYTTVTSMPMGVKLALATDVVEDVWTAPAIAVGAAGQAMAAMGGEGAVREELRQLAQQVKSTLVGLPLKQVTVTENKSATKGSGVMGMLARRAGGGAGGNAGTTTTTVTVRDLVEASLPASTFQIPAGYAETEIMQRGPAMPDLGEGGR